MAMCGYKSFSQMYFIKPSTSETKEGDGNNNYSLLHIRHKYESMPYQWNLKIKITVANTVDLND